MIKSSLIFLSVACLVISTVHSQVNSQEEVKKFIENEYQNKEFIGISVGVISKDGKFWSYKKGYSDREKKIEFTSNTVTRIASVTKSITAVAIMQLVEKGKLNLNTKVGTILQDFNNGDKSKVTIRHLLEHSSGIPHYMNKKEINNKINYDSLQEVYEIYKNRELFFEPGEKFMYSVYGYVTLGLIIEKVTGLSYESYLKENIFSKAKMNNSSVETLKYKNYLIAKLYHKHSKRKIKEINNHNISDRLPAGGVLSTLNDMLMFGKALLNGDLISKESLDLLFKDSGLEVAPNNNPYGMGFRIYGKGKNMGLIVGHNGQQLGCSSFLFLFPDRGITTVVLSNTSVYKGTGKIGINLFELGKSL